MASELDSEPLVFASPAQEQIFNDIRFVLPNFPEQLIYHWLLPFAEDIGWPPDLDASPMAKIARWRGILQRPLSFWRAVTWSLERLSPDQLTFTEKAMRGFRDMIEGHACDRPTLLTVFLGDSSKRRFIQQVNNVLRTGGFTEPPAIVNVGTHFEVVDGNHRIAALYFVMSDITLRAVHERNGWPSEPLSETQEFWVAHPSVGELWAAGANEAPGTLEDI